MSEISFDAQSSSPSSVLSNASHSPLYDSTVCGLMSSWRSTLKFGDDGFSDEG